MPGSDVTQLIQQWQSGDSAALDRLTPFVYDELKRLARGYMSHESAGHTLQATALVNEAFVKLVGTKVDYQNRGHFVAIAARLMRQILVDHARAKQTLKKGAGVANETLHEGNVADQRETAGIVEMDMALEKLAGVDARLADVVELVFFGGLTYDEAADHLGVARTTLYQDLRLAKAWLKTEMA